LSFVLHGANAMYCARIEGNGSIFHNLAIQIHQMLSQTTERCAVPSATAEQLITNRRHASGRVVMSPWKMLNYSQLRNGYIFVQQPHSVVRCLWPCL